MSQQIIYKLKKRKPRQMLHTTMVHTHTLSMFNIILNSFFTLHFAHTIQTSM